MAHEIAKAILWGLNKWRHPNETNNPPDTEYVREEELGWDWFMDGWLACSWSGYQESFGILPRATGPVSNGWQNLSKSFGMCLRICGHIAMVFSIIQSKPNKKFWRKNLMTKFWKSMQLDHKHYRMMR